MSGNVPFSPLSVRLWLTLRAVTLRGWRITNHLPRHDMSLAGEGFVLLLWELEWELAPNARNNKTEACYIRSCTCMQQGFRWTLYFHEDLMCLWAGGVATGETPACMEKGWSNACKLNLDQSLSKVMTSCNYSCHAFQKRQQQQQLNEREASKMSREHLCNNRFHMAPRYLFVFQI